MRNLYKFSFFLLLAIYFVKGSDTPSPKKPEDGPDPDQELVNVSTPPVSSSNESAKSPGKWPIDNNLFGRRNPVGFHLVGGFSPKHFSPKEVKPVRVAPGHYNPLLQGDFSVRQAPGGLNPGGYLPRPNRFPANSGNGDHMDSSDSEEMVPPEMRQQFLPGVQLVAQMDARNRQIARRARQRNRGLGRNEQAIVDSPDDVSSEESNPDIPPIPLDARLVLPPDIPGPSHNRDVEMEEQNTNNPNPPSNVVASSSTSTLVPSSSTSSTFAKTESTSSLSELSELSEEKSPQESPPEQENQSTNTESVMEESLDDPNEYERDRRSTDFGRKSRDPDIEEQCEPLENIIRDLEDYKIDIQFPMWSQYHLQSGSFNREELVVEEVVADKSFVLDRQIIEWASLNHHAVGRGVHGLSLVTSHPDGIYIDDTEIEESISSLSMFQWWNKEEDTLSTGLITAEDATVKWHELNDDNKLVDLWEWNMNFPVHHAVIYKLDDQWKVAVTHAQKGDYDRAVSIYGLDLFENWWFEQRIPGYGKPITVNNGRLLAVLLEDLSTVAVYRYDYDIRKYINLKNITSPDVEDITPFVIGTRSFLGIGGENPVIFEIRGLEFIEMTVKQYMLNHVERYLPVPLGFYRNDAVILFQHKLDHSTHSSSVLEGLKWNGEEFELLDHSPCRSHDEEMYGFSCILDAEGEKGIKGAAVLRTVNDKVNILTASEEYAPIMFEIKTQLVDVPNPMEYEVREIVRAKDDLQERFVYQHRTLEAAERLLYSTSNLNEDLFTADKWKIKEIQAPSVRVEGNIVDSLYEDGTLNVAGQDWRYLDLSIDSTRMFDQIRQNHDRLKTLMNKLKNAVMKTDGLPDAFHDVKISGDVRVSGAVKIGNARIDHLNGLNVDSVLQNAVKKGKDGKLVISGDVTVENLNAENINAKLINGLNIIDPKTTTEPLYIYEDLQIANHIHVLKDVDLTEGGTVNNIDIRRDLYKPGDKSNLDYTYNLYYDSVIVKEKLITNDGVNGYKFTQSDFDRLFNEKRIRDEEYLYNNGALNLDTLSVGDGLQFDYINGRLWKNYTESIVMTDETTTITDLEIEGVLSLDKNLNAEVLNGLDFPRDYVRLDDNASVTISAAKTFANDLQAAELDCEGTINGMDPHDIVTLSTKQNLMNFTFFDLTVTERINIQGDITGKELDKFLSNPLLTEVNEVKSNVIFRNLRVNGTVTVDGKINGTDWDGLFSGIVMNTDEAATIDSFKTFDGHVSFDGGLSIKSGFINNRRVSEFFTTDSDQIINGGILFGNISFERLRLDGTFDGINVSELCTDSVKLTGDQVINSNMIFDYGDDYERTLQVSRLEIERNCNDWDVEEDIVFLDDTVQLKSPQFDRLRVDRLIVEGNLQSKDGVHGIDLDNFNAVRLSKTEPREITASYTAINTTIGSINFDSLNEITKSEIFDIDRKLNNIEREILSGSIDIGSLKISRMLNVTKINGIDLKDFSEKAIWLKDDNYVKTELTFDTISAKNLYIKGKVFDVSYVDYLSDLPRSYDEEIILDGQKTYNELTTDNITAEYINDFEVSNILTLNEDQNIKGIVHITGNMIVIKNLHLESDFKGVNMNRLAESFKYDDMYHLSGDFELLYDATIENLIHKGLINDAHNLSEILTNAASINEDNYFNNTITLIKPVKVHNNMTIFGTYNDLNVDRLFDDLVTTNTDVLVESRVVFEKPPKIEGVLFVDKNLSSDYVNDCSVNEWEDTAVYLDRQIEISGEKSFENLTITGKIYVDTLNGIPFGQFITLNTDQRVNGNFKFKNVFVDGNIAVGGQTNDLELIEHRGNTLMTYGNQTVETLIYFHSNVSAINADINAVNYKNIENAVTMDSDRKLYGEYNFYGDNTFENNLNVNEDISGVNFKRWFDDAVYSNGKGSKTIEGNWNARNVVFGDVIGPGTINKLNTDGINKYLRMKEYIVRSNLDNFKIKYDEVCWEINALTDGINKKSYRFNYFERSDSISSVDFSSIHRFTYGGENYLIMGDKWNCKGYLWKWGQFQFKKINRIEMGCPRKWYTIGTKKSVYLLSIASTECECKITGTTLWAFDGKTLEFIETLAPVNSVSVDDGSFYAIKSGALFKYIIRDEAEINLDEIDMSIRSDSFLPGYSDLVISDGGLIQFTRGLAVPILNRDVVFAEDITKIYVGRKRKELTAVKWPTNVSTSEITIYEDVFRGVIFQRLQAKNPSSLVSINLPSQETLLLFIEDQKYVQVYSYHGFQGFKHMFRLNIPAEQLQIMEAEDIYVIIAGDGVLTTAKVVMQGQYINLIKICN